MMMKHGASHLKSIISKLAILIDKRHEIKQQRVNMLKNKLYVLKCEKLKGVYQGKRK